MIGSGLKKLAQENGMTVSHGVAYGSLRGYCATMWEGSGYKQIVFSVKFADAAQKTQFMDAVTAVGDDQLYKKYRVRSMNTSAGTMGIVFHDAMGTMGKIRECLDWFVPLLETYGASRVDVCSHCGMPLTDSQWVMVSGICYHVHKGCADAMERVIAQSNEEEKQNRTGSYVSGTIGALLGAVLGAAVWALVLFIGYVASIVGLLIGWLSNKGYDLLGGRKGKGKVAILIVAVIFGVLLGTIAADVISIAQMISSGELAGATYADIPAVLAFVFEDPEYISATTSNVLMGLLLAGIGVFAMLRNTGREVADVKFVRLG